MLVIILSILDVFSGLILLTYGSFTILHGFIGYMAAYSFFKGAISFLSSIGMGYYFDWMGIIDVITGFVLLLLMWGFSFGFIPTIGVVATLKGMYSLLRGVFKI